MSAADEGYVCPQCGPDPRGWKVHGEEVHTWPPRTVSADAELAVLRVNWDALRMLMQNEVTMYRQIAADFSEEDMPYARQRCESMAEHAQRVLDAMDQLEKSAGNR